MTPAGRVMTLARDERADLATFLQTLTPEQWDAPTLCTEWRVRDVVAHVFSYEELSFGRIGLRFLQAGFNPARVNALGVADFAGLSAEDLVALARDHLRPNGLTAQLGGRIALTDGLIHHQDIRRSLGQLREIPAERVTAALDTARSAPTIGAARRIRGLRLTATDLDWSTGRGPEVNGPAEPLLMAIAGRHGIVGELSGPGLSTLADRIEGRRDMPRGQR